MSRLARVVVARSRGGCERILVDKARGISKKGAILTTTSRLLMLKRLSVRRRIKLYKKRKNMQETKTSTEIVLICFPSSKKKGWAKGGTGLYSGIPPFVIG